MKKMIIRYGDLALKTTATDNNTHIEDSYKVKSPIIMEIILSIIREECGDSELAIHKIPMKEMIIEWRAHNLLYSLGIKRNRTKDVDLNLGNPWYRKIAYTILSLFYFHFI